MKHVLPLMLATLLAVPCTGSEPFRGQLYNYKGKPIKRAKIYTHNPKKYIRPNKDGSFLMNDVAPDDTIHIRYVGKIFDIPVDSAKGMSIKIGDRYLTDDEMVRMGDGTNTTAPKIIMECLGLPLEEAGFATSIYFIFRTAGCFLGAFLLRSMPEKLFSASAW